MDKNMKLLSTKLIGINGDKNISPESIDIVNSKKVDESISELICQIKGILEYFNKGRVDVAATKAIFCFLESLQGNRKLAISSGELSGKNNHIVFGRALVMNVFIDNIEPALKLIFPCGSFGYTIFRNSDLWPIRESFLNPEYTLHERIKSLKFPIDAYANILSGAEVLSDASSDDEMEIAVETCQMLWEVLSVICNCTSSLQVNWCKYCFRRAEQNLLVCRMHMPSSDDTEYKKAKRISGKFKSDYKKKFKRYQQLRLLIGDNPDFLINPNEFFVSTDVNFMVTNIHDYYFCMQTQKEGWEKSHNSWLKKIDKEFPHVARVIEQKGSNDAASWSEFVDCLFLGIKEPVEKNIHPFWVMRILEISEIYFSYEDAFGDTRKSDTAKKILELYNSGKKQSEIVKIVGVNKQRVSRVIATRKVKRGILGNNFR